jgi:hypothetical protein
MPDQSRLTEPISLEDLKLLISEVVVTEENKPMNT